MCSYLSHITHICIYIYIVYIYLAIYLRYNVHRYAKNERDMLNIYVKSVPQWLYIIEFRRALRAPAAKWGTTVSPMHIAQYCSVFCLYSNNSFWSLCQCAERVFFSLIYHTYISCIYITIYIIYTYLHIYILIALFTWAMCRWWSL